MRAIIALETMRAGAQECARRFVPRAGGLVAAAIMLAAAGCDPAEH
jgi:hypothetical protein